MNPPFLTLPNIFDRLCWTEVFGNTHPVELDLGAGDGGFAAAMATRYPERNFLAVERLLGRVRKIEKKAKRLVLPNLRVLRLETSYTLQYLIPAGSVSAIHLLCPDPWPKRRHLKNRIVQEAFVRYVAEALTPQGFFHFATDHTEYFASGSEIIDQCPLLKPSDASPWPEIPTTDFEREFAKEGRPLHRRFWVK